MVDSAVTTDNGKSALEKLNNARFDLLLCDIHMPGMNGFELVQEVKKIRPDLPILSMPLCPYS
jgi:YesN/AraC family two-component response regulator